MKYDPLAKLQEESQQETYENYYAKLLEIERWNEKEEIKDFSRTRTLRILSEMPCVIDIEIEKRVTALNILFPSNNPESDNRVYLRNLPITHIDQSEDYSKHDKAVRYGLDFFGRVMDNAGVDVRESEFRIEGYRAENAAHYDSARRLIQLRKGAFSTVVQDVIHEAAHHWEESLSVNKTRKNGLGDEIYAVYVNITPNSKKKRYPAIPSKQFAGKYRKSSIKLPNIDYITCEPPVVKPKKESVHKEILQEFLRLLYINPALIAVQHPQFFKKMMRFLR